LQTDVELNIVKRSKTAYRKEFPGMEVLNWCS